MEREPLADIGGFPDVEARIDECLGPPFLVFNLDGSLAWPLQDDRRIRAKELTPAADPPKRVDSGIVREINGAPCSDLPDGASCRGHIHFCHHHAPKLNSGWPSAVVGRSEQQYEP